MRERLRNEETSLLRFSFRVSNEECKKETKNERKENIQK
jgi:hypothetical protein